MGSNLQDGAHGLSEILTRHWIDTVWSSPAIAGLTLLLLIGVAYSLWRTGGRLLDWYFLGAEAAFLLWSWLFDVRFLMPTTPFAVLYAWRGVKAIQRAATWMPRTTGALGIVVALALGTHASLWAFGLRSEDVAAGRLQADLSALAWGVVAVASTWMIWSGRRPFGARPLGRPPFWTEAGRKKLVGAGAVLLLALVAVGVKQQVRMGWDNLNLTEADLNPPDVAGAKWIAAHTPEDAVVLARHFAVVYYYARRSVYWFPPISRPAILMEGIRKRHVDYILVVKRKHPFYQPSDEECFEPLVEAYPEALRLAAEGRDYRVFQVLADARSGG